MTQGSNPASRLRGCMPALHTPRSIPPSADASTHLSTGSVRLRSLCCLTRICSYVDRPPRTCWQHHTHTHAHRQPPRDSTLWVLSDSTPRGATRRFVSPGGYCLTTSDTAGGEPERGWRAGHHHHLAASGGLCGVLAQVVQCPHRIRLDVDIAPGNIGTHPGTRISGP
jgi:hypothetical protein